MLLRESCEISASEYTNQSQIWKHTLKLELSFVDAMVDHTYEITLN